MQTNVNLAAPIGALALLGTGLLLGLSIIVLAYFLARRKRAHAKRVFVAIAIISAVYVAALVAFSFASHETVLARGQEKHFCELDCHLAYSIVKTAHTKTIGASPNPLIAQGQFTVITLKTRFDETTISS